MECATHSDPTPLCRMFFSVSGCAFADLFLTESLSHPTASSVFRQVLDDICCFSLWSGSLTSARIRPTATPLPRSTVLCLYLGVRRRVRAFAARRLMRLRCVPLPVFERIAMFVIVRKRAERICHRNPVHPGNDVWILRGVDHAPLAVRDRDPRALHPWLTRADRVVVDVRTHTRRLDYCRRSPS